MRLPLLDFVRRSAAFAACVWDRVLNLRSRQLSPVNQKPDSARQIKPNCGLYEDGRSKKVIFLAHCLLNQNARDAGTAEFPAMMGPLLEALATEGIGIVQLPCPELMVLGLGRGHGISPLTTIRERLEQPESLIGLAQLANGVVHQIKEYREHGFQVAGIVGKNESPTCAVQPILYQSLFGSTEGVFIRILRQQLKVEGLRIEFKGIDDHRQQEAIEWVSQLMKV